MCRYKLVPVWTRWFFTVCLPPNGCCREESARYYTKRHSKIVRVGINWIFCSTSQFLAQGGSPDTFVIAKASTWNEDYAIVAQACFFTSIIQCCFFDLHVGVVRASHIHSAKFLLKSLDAFLWNLHQRKCFTIIWIFSVQKVCQANYKLKIIGAFWCCLSFSSSSRPDRSHECTFPLTRTRADTSATVSLSFFTRSLFPIPSSSCTVSSCVADY